MKLGVQKREYLNGGGKLGRGTLHEFDAMVGAIAAWTQREHDDDGFHTDITAKSATITAIRGMALNVVHGLGLFGGGVAMSGTVTPPTITADVGTFSPPGIDDAFCVRVQTSAVWEISGIQDGPRLIPISGRLLFLFNAGGAAFTLLHEDLGASPNFRFRLPGSQSLSITPNNSALLVYDGISRRWTVLATSAGASTGLVFTEYDAGDSGHNITIDWANGAQQIVTLTADANIHFVNGVAGGFYRLFLKENVVGGFVPSFDSDVLLENEVFTPDAILANQILRMTPSFSTILGGVYLAAFTSDETQNVAGSEWLPDVLLMEGSDSAATAAAPTSSPLTTKGDVYTYDTANARLPVGSDGDVLTADSTQAKGIKWAAPTGGGAPASADYWVETANAGLSAEVVVGATGITTAAEASKQAAAKAGRLFFPSDGFSVQRDSGSAWVPWGPLFPLADPALASISTWVNQGGASVSTTNGGVFLLAPASATSSVRMRVKSAPSTPYTITALILPTVDVRESYQTSCVGIGFREASSGKLHLFMYYPVTNNVGYLASSKWDSATSFSAHYVGSNTFAPCPRFLRIADNGTNRVLSFSEDGQNFTTFHTVGRTDFLTADQVGFWAAAGSSNVYTAGVTLISWKEA